MGEGVPPKQWLSALWAEQAKVPRIWGEESRRDLGKGQGLAPSVSRKVALVPWKGMELKIKAPPQSLGFGIEHIISLSHGEVATTGSFAGLLGGLAEAMPVNAGFGEAQLTLGHMVVHCT